MYYKIQDNHVYMVYVLVIFDYYDHENRLGYICGRSYLESTYPDTYKEILNYYFVSKNGDRYRLSDAIDFRPIRDNGTTSFSFSLPNFVL